jgi:hypothetical protein
MTKKDGVAENQSPHVSPRAPTSGRSEMNLEYSRTASIYALSMSTSAQLLYRRAETARARESPLAARL